MVERRASSWWRDAVGEVSGKPWYAVLAACAGGLGVAVARADSVPLGVAVAAGGLVLGAALLAFRTRP